MSDSFEKTVSRLERDADTQYRRAIAAEAEVKRLTAEVDDLRKHNANQQELIAALRQNSADLVVSIQLLQAEAEPHNERMVILENLQDENATLRSRLAAAKRQTDEIKRLEAVCDDLSDKLDAANATPNHTDSEKLAFARNEIDWLRNTLDEAQARIRHLEATRR